MVTVELMPNCFFVQSLVSAWHKLRRLLSHHKLFLSHCHYFSDSWLFNLRHRLILYQMKGMLASCMRTTVGVLKLDSLSIFIGCSFDSFHCKFHDYFMSCLLILLLSSHEHCGVVFYWTCYELRDYVVVAVLLLLAIKTLRLTWAVGL